MPPKSPKNAPATLVAPQQAFQAQPLLSLHRSALGFSSLRRYNSASVLQLVEEITKLRLEMGLSKAGLARKLGLVTRTVAEWEKAEGGHLPTKASFHKFLLLVRDFYQKRALEALEGDFRT